MLEVGNGGMTNEEYRTHFSLWAEMAAPLIAGNDLTKMTAETHDILTNKEVIAVDQDALGRQGDRITRQGDTEVWSRPLADGGRAVILLNRGTGPQNIRVDWQGIGYPAGLKLHVRDLWQHKDLAESAGQFEASVPSHGVVMVRLSM